MSAIFTVLAHRSYKMLDNKSKTSLIRHVQKNYITHEVNSVILILRTCIILLSSFMVYIFLYILWGSFPGVFLKQSTLRGISDL